MCCEIVYYMCYISFLLSSFYRLSQRSDSAPDVTSLCTDILPHVTLSAFILISGFKCFSIVPNFYMCSHLPFHMLSLFFPCALTLFTTFSELLWHFIFLWLTFVMLPTYPDAVYKPMYLLSSSSVCKLMLIHLLSYLLSKSPLSSQVPLFSRRSPCPLVTIYLLRRNSDPLTLCPNFWQILGPPFNRWGHNTYIEAKS